LDLLCNVSCQNVLNVRGPSTISFSSTLPSFVSLICTELLTIAPSRVGSTNVLLLHHRQAYTLSVREYNRMFVELTSSAFRGVLGWMLAPGFI
jgi:hypothetical protein